MGVYHKAQFLVQIFSFFFLVHINDLVTPSPIYKYVDDGTIFEICQQMYHVPTSGISRCRNKMVAG